MKKLISVLRLSLIPVTAFFAITFLLSACKKDVDTPAQNPAAGLMAFNLIPDKQSIGIALSNNSLTTSPLYFTNYTGGYQGIYVGSRQVTAYDFASGATLSTSTQDFNDSAYYSLFVVGSSGHYRNVIVKDNFDSLPKITGNAFVRYINAIADSTSQPSVTISSNSTNVFNENAAFGSVSDFKGITPGSISINVKNESTIDSTRTITVDAGKVYTILLTGVPGTTDTNKAVQIKFVQNGSVTP